MEILNRAKEPSTWAGIAAVLAVAGVNIDPGTWQLLVQAATALAGIAAMFMKERNDA